MKATTKRYCYSGQASSRDCRGYGDARASACTTFGSWKFVIVAGKSEAEPGRGRKDPYGGWWGKRRKGGRGHDRALAKPTD
jgi:hypothetical protein